MAGNNLSPRQKMIGMMYLVLTALLALNVSKQVLDAFSKINNGSSFVLTFIILNALLTIFCAKFRLPDFRILLINKLTR